MSDNEQEYNLRKKAIFDSMSKRGQEHVLRIGYDNWNPFQEPKDPRERIFSSSALTAGILVKEFIRLQQTQELSPALYKDLFEICKGLLDGDLRSGLIFEFCQWFKTRSNKEIP